MICNLPSLVHPCHAYASSRARLSAPTKVETMLLGRSLDRLSREAYSPPANGAVNHDAGKGGGCEKNDPTDAQPCSRSHQRLELE
jgi:hypothetical protein